MPDSESYGSKLLRFWAPNGWAALWLLILGLAPLFFYQTLIHEGLHWLTAIGAGTDPTLIPFAHLNTSFGTGGSNLNGATMNTDGFVAMPQIVVFLAMVGLIFVFIFTSPPWGWLRMFLTWWYLGMIIDLLFNTGLGLFGVFNPGTDWTKFANLAGNASAIAVSWLMLIVILAQLGWIAFSKWHVNRPPGRSFFEFRGFAIFLAAVSLIAIIVSLTVNHPAIVRNWWFWLIWSWQLASLLFYIAYIIWASVRQR